jgi:hypothetical protein
MLLDTTGLPQLSVAEEMREEALIKICPVEFREKVEEGLRQVMLGPTLSTTKMSEVQLLEFPEPSVDLRITGLFPMLAHVKDVTLATTETFPQISVELETLLMFPIEADPV